VCQTFFFIPHRLMGIPVFGWGWMLGVWVIGSVIAIGWMARKFSLENAVKELALFLLITGGAIVFALPMLEAKAPDGTVLGLPVRGYGTLLTTAVVAAWWLAARRSAQAGFSPETVTSLGLPTVIAGILGARLFYVIEYWDDFRADTWLGTLAKIVQFTEGGLVVYGSVLGGAVAVIWFARHHRLPILALGDVVLPAVILGMAIGRIGCLMNGCCFGGECEQQWGIQFPRYSSIRQQVISPPYQKQLETGRLHGFVLGANERGQPIVRSVDKGSVADRNGLTAGVRLAAINGWKTESIADAHKVLASAKEKLTVDLVDGQKISWSIETLPEYSRPVHPSQIYGAISGALILLVLLSSEPFFNRHGAIVALTLTLYPPVRFLEEMIRDDEPAQWGTSLTISQLVSIAVLVTAAILWVFVLRRETRGAALRLT
jgi:phosphatidylglycerol:prolipoprotein diacylglycerol transferase